MNEHEKYKRLCKLYKIETREQITEDWYYIIILFDYKHEFRAREEFPKRMEIEKGYDYTIKALFAYCVEQGYRRFKKEQAIKVLDKLNRKDRNIVKRYLR